MRSASSPRAVSMMMGTRERWRSSRQTSNPDPSGSITSSRTRSGSTRPARSSASAAVPATWVSKPSRPRASASGSVIEGSSSTRRTVRLRCISEFCPFSAPIQPKMSSREAARPRAPERFSFLAVRSCCPLMTKRPHLAWGRFCARQLGDESGREGRPASRRRLRRRGRSCRRGRHRCRRRRRGRGSCRGGRRRRLGRRRHRPAVRRRCNAGRSRARPRRTGR